MFTESLILFIGTIVSLNTSDNTTSPKQVVTESKIKAPVEVVLPMVNERKCGGWDGN